MLGSVGLLSADIVIPAALITVAMVFALFAYALMSSTDFTMLGGALSIFGIILLVGSLIGLFWKNNIYHLIFACAGAFFFGLYIIFDI